MGVAVCSLTFSNHPVPIWRLLVINLRERHIAILDWQITGFPHLINFLRVINEFPTPLGCIFIAILMRTQCVFIMGTMWLLHELLLISVKSAPLPLPCGSLHLSWEGWVSTVDNALSFLLASVITIHCPAHQHSQCPSTTGGVICVCMYLWSPVAVMDGLSLSLLTLQLIPVVRSLDGSISDNSIWGMCHSSGDQWNFN